MVIVAIESHQGAIDMQVTTIGLDIAKNVFQVHGIDAAEKVVVPEATSAQPDAGVLSRAAALSAWRGLRHRPVGRVNSRSLVTRFV